VLNDGTSSTVVSFKQSLCRSAGGVCRQGQTDRSRLMLLKRGITNTADLNLVDFSAALCRPVDYVYLEVACPHFGATTAPYTNGPH
jgi:hypothetical protein